MVFSSLEFVFRFLPVFLVIYYIVPGRWKNLWLFMGSLGFYFYGVRDTPFYFVLLVLSILVNYQIGILIGRCRIRRFRKRWLVYGVIYNLFWLILFKYAGFLIQNLNLLLNMLKIPVKWPVIAPVLPVGISFYTFQAISYLADVYRKTVPCERSLVGFGMYITMFPQLIAGPIVTYSSVRRQIGRRRITFQAIEDGLREFTIGLGCKVLLANRIGGLWSDVRTIGYDSISTPLAWLGLAAFSLQIYFDFCGYSLMAKGLGSMMGFQFPDNFHHPYMSLSMTEFWRRWHMTLGSWFREYVYIPLGGNRRGPLLAFRNLLAVWFLTGFWHGASWNFIIWGLFAIFHPIRGTSGSYPYTGTMEDGRPSLYGIHDTAYVAYLCSHGHKTNYSVFPKAVPGICPAATILLFQRRLCEVCKTVCSFPGSGVIVHDRHSHTYICPV